MTRIAHIQTVERGGARLAIVRELREHHGRRLWCLLELRLVTQPEK